LDGGTPITARERFDTTVRNAVAGIELSMELVVVRVDSFSISAGRMAGGSLSTSGARLHYVRDRDVHIKFIRDTNHLTAKF
jgi:hypothetical protein